MKWILTLTVFLFALTACTASQTQPTPAPVSTNTALANMPNPASVYCLEQGFTSEIRTAADGSQSGVCIFPDGSECDEWAFFRNECSAALTATQTPIVNTNSTFSIDLMIPQLVSIPAGVIVDPRNGISGMTQGLIFYDTDGLTLGELLAPFASQNHAAGNYQGSLNFPLVFHALDTESRKQYLMLNNGSTQTDPGGQVSVLAPLDDKDMLSGLVGVPGEPILFYIVFQPIDATLRSQFVFGNMDSISAATPILTLESNESRYWVPVAIQMKDGTPNGLWFTRTPWGIGGDIVFSYQEGLSYLDLTSGKIHEALAADENLSSLSLDQTWVAYTIHSDTGSEFFIRNLMGGDPIAIPSLPESNRGAGDGVFSPSNKYIAWREAQGSLFDGNFQQTIRVSTLDGQIVGDFKDVSFYKTAELSGGGIQIKPVNWLDDETILVQVVAPEKPHNGSLVALNVTTGQSMLFAQGFLAGWFYP